MTRKDPETGRFVRRKAKYVHPIISQILARTHVGISNRGAIRAVAERLKRGTRTFFEDRGGSNEKTQTQSVF